MGKGWGSGTQSNRDSQRQHMRDKKEMCLEEWGVVDSALQEMRWTHERAEGKGGIGLCSPLLHRMEYLLPGLAFP